MPRRDPERARRAAEELAGAATDSYKIAVERAFSARESSARLTRDFFEEGMDLAAENAELNLRTTRRLADTAREHSETFRQLSEGSSDAYADFLDSLFVYGGEEREPADEVPTREGTPGVSQGTDELGWGVGGRGENGIANVTPLAAGVLERNGIGAWTRPAPHLYPHQWSWDSAFIALGLAHSDNRRATSELETLFASQWADGKVPHIVYNPEAPQKSYFPDAERWNSSALASHAPATRHTSGLCQPPVHAIAVLRIWETARGADERRAERARRFLEGNYPRLMAWHRYLATNRDPEDTGLVTIYHPWESGTDNSPRWDGPLSRVEVGEVPPYTRYDLQHVTDPSHRPTDAEYDRYLWLLESLKRVAYEEARVYESHPFLVKDVLFSAILVAANEALLRIAEVVDAPGEDRLWIEGRVERGREGLARRWDAQLGLCLDYDLHADEPCAVRTIAGFAPLIAGGMDPERQGEMLRILDSPLFAGNQNLRWPLPPSTSPNEAGFHPRAYWRGPSWPVANWLLWWSLLRAGEPRRAASLRQASLEQLAEGGFAEYFEPFTGEPLGSPEQSWTAAVALDFLAAETTEG